MSDTYTTAIWRQPGYDLAGTNQSTVALQGNVAALSLYCWYDITSIPLTLQYTPQTISFNEMPVNQFVNASSGEHGDVVYIAGTQGGYSHIVAFKIHYDKGSGTESDRREILWNSNVGSSSGAIIPTICPSSVGGQEKIFINYNNNIYSINPTDGTKTKLTVFTDTVGRGNIPVFFNGVDALYTVICDTSNNGRLYKFNLSGGTLWNTAILGVYTDPINLKIVHNGNNLYVAIGYGGSGNLICRINDSTANIDVAKSGPSLNNIQIAFNPNIGLIGGTFYILTQTGIYTYDHALNYISTQVLDTSDHGRFAIRKSDGILFACLGRYNQIMAQKTTNLGAFIDTGFRYTLGAVEGNIIIDKNDNIIVTTTANNLHILTFSAITGFTEVRKIALQIPANIGYPPSIGSNGLLYLTTTSTDTFYAYGTGVSPYIPSTSSSESSSSSSSSSSQSLESESSESSLSSVPVTTTTTTSSTTTLGPLAYVQTIAYLPNATEISNASDSPQTIGALARTFAFGTIAPNEVSKTIVVALFIPKVAGIQNIKLGLISTGGIEFANDLFGITNSSELRYDIVPDTYFQNINLDKTATNAYNISIPNRNLNNSNYVYLNVKLPESQPIGTGIINYRWFFDYSD